MKPVDIWNRVYGDFLMPSRLALYEDILTSALRAGYHLISVEGFWALLQERRVNPSERYLILRHDVDTDPATASAVWAIEERLGIEASYYFRMATLDLDLMRAIGRGGSHASYHYEDLATIVKRRHLKHRDAVLESVTEAQELFRQNITKLRRATGLPMTVVASHGDFVNRKMLIPNWAILADRRFRRDVGIELETYDEVFMRHVSSRHADTGHPTYWASADPASAIDLRSPVVYLLTHPRNWRADPAVNLRDNLNRLQEGIRYSLPTGRRTSRPSRPSVRRGESVAEDTQTASAGAGRVQFPPLDSPVLLVGTPASYPAERRYVLDVVLSDWLGIRYELVEGREPGVTIRLAGDPGGRVLVLPDVLFATPPDEWLTEASMPTPPLERIDVPASIGRAGSARLPVLFGAVAPDGRAWVESPAGLTLAVDVLGSIFFLLTRYEEIVRRVRDDHDRFPAYASLGAVERFLERPIADDYVDLLWAAIQTLWPALARRERTFRLWLTHDVDQPWAGLGQPAALVARSFTADLFDRRDVALAAKRGWSFLASRAGKLSLDPFNTFDLLMTTSERLGLRSTFFFLASAASGGNDGRYRLTDRPITRLLTRIHERGHEIGLHASYDSYRSKDELSAEFDALRAACAAVGIDQAQWGVRQHFLRFENPQTWRNHAAAGFQYDSTLAFADHVGFRAGTSHEFQVFDLEVRRPLAVRERPLVVMDATLLGYMGLDLDAASDRAIEVVGACRRHGGQATICYHNSTLPGARQQRHYRDLARELAIGSATMSESPVRSGPGGLRDFGQ